MGYQGKTLAAALHNLNLPMQTAVHSGDQCKLRKKKQKTKPSKATGAKAGRENAYSKSLRIFYVGRDSEGH